MKALLVIFSIMFSPCAGFSAEIATVTLSSIKDELRDYLFSKPGNAELKKQYEEAEVEKNRFMEEMQKKVMRGESPVDLTDRGLAGVMINPFELEQKVDALMKKELYLIVSDMGLEYYFIVDDSATDAVIFAKGPVANLTPILRQKIYDLGREKNSAQKELEKNGNK